MIFITVGTTSFPFQRMVDIVKNIINIRNNSEAIVFQYGKATVDDIKAKNIYFYAELPFEKMQQYLADARVVICHGGPATIFQCIKIGKKPIVIPREKKFNEHINNHQVYFCESLISANLVNGIKMIDLINSKTKSKIMIYENRSKIKVIKYLLKYIN
jgi:UDP-N-acetylglucosamine transferase subunit ALG13